ncbi:MAG: response regulator [Chloroflexi bacterium]|nr:response regulator [Chloroflexota bacterium]
MPEPQGLTAHVLDQVVALSRDHRQLLVDLALRVEPFSNELLALWTKVYQETAVRQPPPPDEVVRAIQEEAIRVLLGGLRDGDLPKYYGDIAAWASRTARSGLAYDQIVELVRAYQRSGLTLLLRAYPAGAELELVLGALDDLYAGTITLIAAVYIQALQDQLMDSARPRAFGQLAIGATHSLNNLLTAILGRTQLLLERTRDAESRGELQEVQRTATLGAQTVRHLQEYARGVRDQEFVEADVNNLLRDAAEITRFVWRDEAEAHGIVIDVVKDFGDIPPALARRNELREVFIALILNAIEAMPRGGLITLRTERKDDSVLVAVIDTGEGMTEETRRRVFDPFFSTKGTGHTGLGLSIASNLVGQHKGMLTVESQPGRGSAFTVSIPVAPGTLAPKAEAAPVSVRTVRILIVDDEPTVRDIVAKFLAFRGYQVAVADSGYDGIAAFKRARFDLVVTDLGMPGMSGWEVAREVKRLRPQTLVVLMTGWAADLDQEKVKESGVDHIVHKPFNVDDVLTLVNEAVALREKM